jgi:outer membrane protein TolC
MKTFLPRPKKLAVLLLAVAGIGGPVAAGELGDVLRAALDHPAVEARKRQVEGAEGDLSAATTQYFGRGSLVADRTRYEGQRVVGIYVPGQTAPLFKNDAIIRYGVSYALPVDVFGVITASREKFKNNLAAAELLARQETLLRLHQAGNAYVRKQALQAQADALRIQRERVEASAGRVRKEAELGRAAEIDVRLAQSEVARISADEARLKGILGETRADLIDASGIDPENGSLRISVPEWNPFDADATLSARLADAKARAAEAGASELRRNLLPSFSLGADYYNNKGGGGDMDTWSMMGRVSIPLDAGAYLRSSAEGARALAAEDDRRAALRAARRQIAALQSAYDSARADAEALEKEIAYRSEVVEVDQERWRLGALTLENLLRQRRDLLDAQYRFADARARAAAAWSSAQVLAGTPPDTYIAQWDKP